MLTPEVLQRLARIRDPAAARGPWRSSPSAESPGLLTAAASPHPIEKPDASSLALLGREVQTPCGTHWRVDSDVEQIWSHGPSVVQRRALARGAHDDLNEHPELVALQEAFPSGLLLLDLETCGFAGSMVFLAGLVHQQQQRLVLTQLLARDYGEERAMLFSLWSIAAGKRVLVTFNGKSFDWPTVLDRSTVHRLGHDADQPGGKAPLERSDPRPHLTHCDLLHHCRRRWKETLPNCKLQTLETFICGRRRSGDIPGALIPHVYHAFVREGDPAHLRQVLRHNALDLVTLLQLASVI